MKLHLRNDTADLSFLLWDSVLVALRPSRGNAKVQVTRQAPNVKERLLRRPVTSPTLSVLRLCHFADHRGALSNLLVQRLERGSDVFLEFMVRLERGFNRDQVSGNLNLVSLRLRPRR